MPRNEILATSLLLVFSHRISSCEAVNQFSFRNSSVETKTLRYEFNLHYNLNLLLTDY